MLIMCPECDRLCDYVNLSDSCFHARFTRVFDNYATIAMAVFMSGWGQCSAYTLGMTYCSSLICKKRFKAFVKFQERYF